MLLSLRNFHTLLSQLLLRIQLMPLIIVITAVLLGGKITQFLQIETVAAFFKTPLLFAQTISEPKNLDNNEIQPEADQNPSLPAVNGDKKTVPPLTGSRMTALERITYDLGNQQKTFDPLELTASEVMLLMSLSKRREQIAQREENYEAREALVQAVEKRIDQKINELTQIRDEISTLYNNIQKHNDETTKRLVKVYEAMKPKNAARIFEQLNDSIAVPILEMMSEKKASELMAKLTPERAKKLTFLLADRRKFLDLPRVEAAPEVSLP